MNEMSSKPDPLDSLFAPEDWEDYEGDRIMGATRKSRARLPRDSGWALRLNEVVARANKSVFTPAPSPDGRKTLFAAEGDIDTAPRAETWAGLRVIQPRARKYELGGAPLAHHYRDSAVSRAFDLLRTRLMHTLRQNGWTRIAIAAPTRGCGATFTSVNLAMSLSRVPNSRSILMDMDQRNPGVADALDVHGVGEIRHFLSGQVPMSQHIVRLSDTLALGLNTLPFQDSADILHDRTTTRVLDDMHTALTPDVVLYDMPAVLAYDDLGAFLPQVDGVLLISDATKTTARDIAECERVLAGQAPLLGVILNRARASSVQKYSQ
ncbi:exopolysaccharide biosynthesis protein [Oceaniglobus ichthyenteri]|uniref:exopolysaccharide biosynthesis protein n=1 Tax=Oceaniglobus ichthyenteri TaxID=2136177 RepID=UPI000D3536F8|nr:exopolysaccharide biosynthesis protein [Oceaniglobus ichthyenteri]